MEKSAAGIIKNLRERGERITPARQTIIEIFYKAKKPLTAAELLSALKKLKVPSNKTTVYRQIEDLLLHGILTEIHFDDGIKRFEILCESHHHHLICINCGKIADVELEESLKKQEKIILKKERFQVLRHSLEFFGRCKKCALKN